MLEESSVEILSEDNQLIAIGRAVFEDDRTQGLFLLNDEVRPEQSLDNAAILRIANHPERRILYSSR